VSASRIAAVIAEPGIHENPTFGVCGGGRVRRLTTLIGEDRAADSVENPDRDGA
jgi:hypothetical protein